MSERAHVERRQAEAEWENKQPDWIVWIWVVQFVFFFFGGLTFFFLPGLTLAFLTWEPPSTLNLMPVSQVRFIGGAISTVALASGMGLLRRDPIFRQGLSLIFAVFLTIWSAVFWYNYLSGRYGLAGVIAFGIPGPITATANWAFYLSQKPGRVTWFLGTQASATTRPSTLWGVWVFQGLLFLFLGSFYLWFPSAWIEILGDGPKMAAMDADNLAFTADQVRMVSAYLIAFGLLSLYATVQVKEWVWREFGWLFGIALICIAWAIFWDRAMMVYNNWAVIYGGLCLGLAGANIAEVRIKEPRMVIPRQGAPEGWLALDLVAGPMMAFQTFTTKRRASHLMGVGARGHFRVWGPAAEEISLARDAARVAALAASPDQSDLAAASAAATIAALELATAAQGPLDATRAHSRKLTGLPPLDRAEKRAQTQQNKAALRQAEARSLRAYRQAAHQALQRDELPEAAAAAGAKAAVSAALRAVAPFPSQALFNPGRRFPLRSRLATLTELDDAALDVRGASLMFAESSEESPFDVMLNTGSFSPVPDLATFGAFVASKFLPTYGSELIVKSNYVALEGAVAGLRRAPDSFSKLYFHTQKVTWWVDDLGHRHLVRYRLRPPDLSEDQQSGLPSADDCSHVWIRTRLQNDFRPGNYLREEMKGLLANGEVRFVLEAQFHEVRDGDNLEWYNSSLDWDAREYPWQVLGEAVLEEALPDAVTERLRFNPANRPPSLGVPASDGIFDPRSVADSEWRVITKLQRLRIWMYDTLGLPRFGNVSGQGE